MAVATRTRPPSDEETPLLRPIDDSHDHVQNQQKEQKETPLPWAQFSLVLFLQLAEPLTSQVIYPFAPQLIRDIGITGGDDTKIGYYVGIMQSVFFATQALTVLHWSRTSDLVGRKPVILTGLAGLAISMYCFGLSRTFVGLVMSRSLNGALNGNIGVIKSMMGEMTDSTNVARAFAYQPMAWSTGATLGPLIGGSLVHPAERFPTLFGSSEFLRTYPYFLPCAIPATFSILAWLVTYFYLKETNPTGFTFRSLIQRKPATLSSKALQLDPSLETPPSQPLSRLLTPPVLTAASAYALLSLLDIAYRALQPVFYAGPRSLGGLGLEPHHIGGQLAMLGLANGIFQVLLFARLVKKWGARKVFLAGVACAAPMFMLFPIMTAIVESEASSQGNGLGGEETVTALSWPLIACIALQLMLTLLLNACYGSIFIYVTAAAPSRRSLGAVNGLAQMSVSVMRCVGPALTSSLYSWSLRWRYAEGGGLTAGLSVYAVMLVLVAVTYVYGMRLPDKPWVREDEE